MCVYIYKLIFVSVIDLRKRPTTKKVLYFVRIQAHFHDIQLIFFKYCYRGQPFWLSLNDTMNINQISLSNWDFFTFHENDDYFKNHFRLVVILEEEEEEIWRNNGVEPCVEGGTEVFRSICKVFFLPQRKDEIL